MGWIVGYEKRAEGKGRWAVENEERAGGSVRAANYNHSCGWRGEETPRGARGYTVMDQAERRTTKRPLPGGWKRVYLPTANTHRYAPTLRTDLDGNLRYSEALAKKIAWQHFARALNCRTDLLSSLLCHTIPFWMVRRTPKFAVRSDASTWMMSLANVLIASLLNNLSKLEKERDKYSPECIQLYEAIKSLSREI